MTFISYSQNLEDVMLWRALLHVDCGFYIDVGAWDPREDSVTLAFYERGWHGINIEPNAGKHRLLSEARPSDTNLAVALSDAPGMRMFYDVPETGLSTLDPAVAGRHRASGREVQERPVAVWTLRDICAAYAPGDIHFLKIDVEGSEAAVLAGADFTRFRPWIVVVEATEPNSPAPSHAEWEPGLLQAGYALAYFDGLNRYYVADERAEELLPAFAQPPNVFDDYVSVAGLRKAVAAQQSGAGLAELQDLPNERQAAREAAEAHALQAALQAAEQHKAEAEAEAAAARAEAVAARAEAEARVMQAEQEALLARADAEWAKRQPPRPAAPAAGPEPALPGRRRLYYDASLMVRYGMETPVGLIRTEHYVAEFLVRDPALDVRFVVFDAAPGEFRALSQAEAALLRRVLFNRYEQATDEPDAHPDLSWEPEPSGTPLMLAQTPAAAPPPASAPRGVLGKALTALALTPHEFDHMLVHYAVRLMPVGPGHGLARRLSVRTARRLVLHAARGSHSVAHGVASKVRGALDAGRHLLRPDREAMADSEPASGTALQLLPSPLPPEPALEEWEPLPAPVSFERGAVLLSLGNSWDYLDYAYLHRLCRDQGVQFVSVIFDVIAMQYPFSTPGPPHLYHRHWVELGHSAAHLLAISKFSAEQYARYISEPNGLSPRMSHAYLPSFLQARADEIGETPIPKLEGRRFAVFCSTIETRKNHQLLIFLWDRLRAEFSPEELPVLVFIGKWGWGTETVRLLTERSHRLRSHLMILDRLGDAELIWAYRNSRFGLFPALSEGYGLAAAESLSFGTPVVIADCPALVEATEGLMPAYDPLDFPAWLDEMRRLIRDDVRLDELRAAASRYRGPGYADFAQALRGIALSLPAPSEAASPELAPRELASRELAP